MLLGFLLIAYNNRLLIAYYYKLLIKADFA